MHGCVRPKGEPSELCLEDTGYAVDLIQLQKRKGGEIYFAVHISQKNRKGKVCWQAGLLGCAKLDKQSVSQQELVGCLYRCRSN